ncbi:MAG: ATP-binding protein [Eubacterium sp.]
MEIKRDIYLNKLIKRRNNSMVKVITGIRRCGKSYLLFNIYYDYLIKDGVKPENIITVALDDIKNKPLRDALNLYNYVSEKIETNETYYVFLDEIQFVDEFADLINGLSHIKNLDIYVTGSNSKFLSSDILTEFRGRGDEIKVYPLSFSEYCSVYTGTVSDAWKDYYTYGGMPLILSCADDEAKADYLSNLFKKVYISDIIERNHIRNDKEFEDLINILASGIGSLTNPKKLANTFKSVLNSNISDKTLKQYIDYLLEAFMIEKAMQYDVKGKKYLETLTKYYFEDIGLRNARLDFRQQEENHIMENIIFNELKMRGYRVDVGVVELWESDNGKRSHKRLEIDFVANKGNNKYYIQSAFAIETAEKEKQEKRSLNKINDSFKKIVVVKDDIKLKRDENGIVTMGIYEFLLNPNSLNL